MKKIDYETIRNWLCLFEMYCKLEALVFEFDKNIVKALTVTPRIEQAKIAWYVS